MNSTGHSSTEWNAGKPWVDILLAGGVDVVLNGHQHNYQRLLTGNVRSFVVGTGGVGFYASNGPPRSGTTVEASNDNTYGFLKLGLHDGSYDWQFVRTAGGSFTDSGTGTCN